MKQLSMITWLLFLITTGCAQSPNNNATTKDGVFITAMQANLKMLDTATAGITLKTLANNFERIGNAEKNRWEPFYYAAYCTALQAAGTKEKSTVDGIEDLADQLLDKAAAISPRNSEISTLKAMILYTRLLVDPVSRWQTMGKEAATYLQHARAEDPSNPRPLVIEARSLLYTPEGLGGGSKAAQPVVEMALTKFAGFVPANSIAPMWGNVLAENMLRSLKKQ